MPKSVDYPRASMTKSIELAESVYRLGGGCTVEMAAENMNRKVGGGFNAVMSAAIKHNLIEKTGDKLTSTQLFKEYRLGYTEEERSEILRKAFLSVPLYLEIYGRFKNGKLPTDILDRLLIREFDVNQQVAARVAKYFVDGARATQLLNDDGGFIDNFEEQPSNTDENTTRMDTPVEPPVGQHQQSEPSIKENTSGFSVHLTGPGMDSLITITEEDDLDIVEVMIKKIRKKLQLVASDQETNEM